MTAPTYTVDRCRSATCGAPIVWGNTAATGDLMPLDAEPVPDGNVELVHREYALPLAVVHPADQPTLFAGDRYVSHFATCPDADRWRRTP